MVKIQIEKSKTDSSDSEFRQDIVTGDWVVIATGRAKRPDSFVAQERITSSNEYDPFENPEESGQEKDILIYRRDDGDWSLRVFPNKYPVVSSGRVAKELSEGPYFGMMGIGHHEVIVTRDAHKSVALFDTWQAAELMDAYQERYIALMNKKSVNYIQILHNHGKEAGASISHPHSQLMALPVISPYIELELRGAEQYYRKNKKRVFETIVEHEIEAKKRIVFENEHFIAFCPFASRVAFEVWIVGKRANPYFERITDEEKCSAGEALQKSLRALYEALGDPAYNFYIHTSPTNGQEYTHYQWHIEILPHTSTWGGLELSTGIEVTTVPPEAAAEYLRSKLS